MHVMKIRALAVAGAALAIALGGASGASAYAADNCWFDRGKGHWYCHNRAHAPIYDGSRVVGYVETTTSWFKCRRDGGKNHGGTHPTRWELTRADTAGHPWGWMSDNDIRSETDPLPTC